MTGASVALTKLYKAEMIDEVRVERWAYERSKGRDRQKRKNNKEEGSYFKTLRQSNLLDCECATADLLIHQATIHRDASGR